MTPEELQALALLHVQATPPTPQHRFDLPQCASDLRAWPCQTRKLLDHIEVLEKRLSGAK